MASKTKRAIILAFSSSINFLVQFITPVFLVRILDINTYGQYKEFILYSGLIIAFINFSINSNLLYFISKDPKNTKSYVSNTLIVMFFISSVCVIIVYVFKGYFLDILSFNFIIPLLIYVFLFLNLDILQYYWLATKRSDSILIYTLIKTIIRVIIVVGIAYLTSDVISMIYGLIGLELLKFVFVSLFIKKKSLFKFAIEKELLKEQFKYVLPLGFSSIILRFNNDISKVIISTSLGAEALALYSVASQRLPLTNIIRSSINEVIFPDMAQNIENKPLEALTLWRKANVLYIFIMFPLFILMWFFAKEIIVTLFTAEYLEATLIFKIYLIFFLKQCFEMGAPLRAKNENKYIFYGHLTSAVINISLLYFLYQLLGFVGPAIAFVTTEIIITIYFGKVIIKIYDIKTSELFYWNKILKLVLVGILTTPILLLQSLFSSDNIISLVTISFIYVVVYAAISYKVNIREVELILNKLLKLKNGK